MRIIPVRQGPVAPIATVAGSSAPAWFSGQTDKTWLQPFDGALATLDGVDPELSPTGVTGFPGLVSAWSGGVVGDDGLYIFGGGHEDYPDNGVYLVNVAQSQMERLSDPSVVTGGDEISYADGQPRIPHTYKQMSETPTHLWMTGQAGPYPSTNSFFTIWKWSKSATEWEFVGTLPQTPAPLGGVECGSFYDSATGLIYVVTTYGEVWTIDPTDDSMTFVYHQNVAGFEFVAGAGTQNALALIPGIALVYRAPTGEVSLFDINDPESGWTEVTVSGTFGLTADYPGLVWHPASAKLIGWGHTTNRANLFTLAPPTTVTNFASLLGTWTAATVTPDGSNAVTPSSPATNCTAGRFNLIEDFCGSGRDLLIILNATNEEPYIYKLPAAGI